jgi:sterol desaturase/sphingolipid hydroxylase (fatty acid hydroxylase superfamily)
MPSSSTGGQLELLLEPLQPFIGERTLAWLAGFLRVALIYVGFLVLERVRPAEREQDRGAILFNFRWWFLYSALTALLMYWVFGAITPGVQRWAGGPLLSVPRSSTWASLIGQSLAFYLVFDFFYYWFHRTQHAVPMLWRLHRLHHTERALNVTTTQRHHWLEEPLRVFFISVPMALLIDVQRAQAGWLGFTWMLWGFFIHSNLRLHLGALAHVFVGPQAHRIHHSLLSVHEGRNYGAFFPIWDIVFRTYWRPAPGEFPPTGLIDVEPPRRLIDASLDPLLEWRTERAVAPLPGAVR